jgi:hypothetical protein
LVGCLGRVCEDGLVERRSRPPPRSATPRHTPQPNRTPTKTRARGNFGRHAERGRIRCPPRPPPAPHIDAHSGANSEATAAAPVRSSGAGQHRLRAARVCAEQPPRWRRACTVRQKGAGAQTQSYQRGCTSVAAAATTNRRSRGSIIVDGRAVGGSWGVAGKASCLGSNGPYTAPPQLPPPPTPNTPPPPTHTPPPHGGKAGAAIATAPAAT